MVLQCARCDSGFEVKNRQGLPLYCANCKKLNARDAARIRRDKKYEEQGAVLLPCVGCGKVFEKPARKGPVPQYCPSCAATRKTEQSKLGMTKRRTEHHGEHLATRRVYYTKNAPTERETSRQWKKANPEYAGKWRKEHPENQASYNAIRRSRTKLSKEDRKQSTAWRKEHKDDPCYYCGKRTEQMHYDHKLPLSRGGTDHHWNLARACSPCNLKKHDKTDTEFIAYLNKNTQKEVTND